MLLKCEHCGIEIRGKGIIDGGLPYDKLCFAELKQDRVGEEFKALSDQYDNEIDYDDLSNLWDSYEGDKIGLKKDLDSNWAAIITDDGDIGIWTYTTKAEMLDNLAYHMDEGLYKGVCVCPIYFMRKGKVIATADDYMLKIVFPKKQK